MIITSKDNPIVKQVKKLLSAAKYRKREGAFVMEGLRLCRDAAQNGVIISATLVTEKFVADFPKDFAEIEGASKAGFIVSESIMNTLSDTPSPQGVICVCEIPSFEALPTKGGKFVLLEQVSDPSNLGAIARTAEAMGIDGLCISGGCDPYHPKALRASMGALLRLPVYSGEMDKILQHMKDLQVKTYAAGVKNADFPVGGVNFEGPCAVVIGNEAGGITPNTVRRCTNTITIPMAGRAESLNAAAAACVLIWEMTGRGGNL